MVTQLNLSHLKKELPKEGKKAKRHIETCFKNEISNTFLTALEFLFIKYHAFTINPAFEPTFVE
jgi:hypothetical protein